MEARLKGGEKKDEKIASLGRRKQRKQVLKNRERERKERKAK